MTFKLTIELSNRDLRHFRRELKRARGTELPDFIGERLQKLQVLQAMLTDSDWPLTDAERSPVLAALAYVCDPEDIIPDAIPGIGLLDDAVMIELVLREVRHETEAYEDFCAYRRSLPQRPRDSEAQARRLERRRDQLMTRMRRRRAAGKR